MDTIQLAAKCLAQNIFSFLLGGLLCCVIAIVVSRLFFHPLSWIPGPKLAAVSGWYSSYYNIIVDGQYSKLFPGLHRKYRSPVIRIGPNAVHVNSLEFYEEVFGLKTNYYKDSAFYKPLGAEGALKSILDPHEHRVYRNHLRPMFSAQSTNAVVPQLKIELRKASAILETHRQEHTPLNIQCLFRAFTSDIVCDALFAESLDFIGDGKEYHPFVAALDRFTAYTWLVLQFPWIKSIQFYLPFKWGERLTPEFTAYKRQCETWFKNAEGRRDADVSLERKTLFDYYVELNASQETTVRTVPQPMEDSFNFLTAGTESTAYSLSCTTFHILNNPQALHNLRQELDASIEFIRDAFDPKKIQALPYLTAVIKESMRLSTAVPGCLPRITPLGGAMVGSIYIPPGTVVSVSHLSVTQNESIFPEPGRFKPERWLSQDSNALDKWHVGFSKGPRRCIGMNLAYLELFSVIAYLFSRFELVLHKTDEGSMEWVDRISARNRSDVQVKILADRWSRCLQ